MRPEPQFEAGEARGSVGSNRLSSQRNVSEQESSVSVPVWKGLGKIILMRSRNECNETWANKVD